MLTKIENIFSIEQLQDIIQRYESHKHKDEIKYFVNETSKYSKEEFGFFANKFIVGVHNRHTHFKIKDLIDTLKLS